MRPKRTTWPQAAAGAILALVLGAAQPLPVHAQQSRPPQEDSLEGQSPTAPNSAYNADNNQITESTEEVSKASEPSIHSGWFPGLMATVPGVIVHGTGHWVAGDNDTALDLLIVEGAGALTALAGLSAIAFTGASRRIVGPAIGATIVGFGLFAQSWVADIWGASTGGRWRGTPALTLPSLQLGAGYHHVYDPQFEYRNFSTFKAQAWLGQFRFNAMAWAALETNNQHFFGQSTYRWFGPTAATANEGTRRASWIETQIGLNFYNFDYEGFDVWTPEVFTSGRWALGDLSPTLRGSFAQIGLGYGLELYNYDIPRLDFAEDVGELLLGEVGYGIFVGPASSQGEVYLFYNHRHDGYAAGLGVNGVGGGALGHFGLEGQYFLTDHWGFSASARVGSAYLAGLQLLYRASPSQ